jgi:restriction system protein
VAFSSFHFADCITKVPSPKVVLIDGDKLIQYMIENDMSVSKEDSYEVKRVDSDFFSEE